jgi:hypothetical protein
MQEININYDGNNIYKWFKVSNIYEIFKKSDVEIK